VPAGALALYRRHLVDCQHFPKGNRWTRCQCPIWVQGSIGGEAVRRSLNTTNWTAATTTIQGWQVSGQIGVLKPEVPTVEEAVKKFLDEAATRKLAATTIKKRRELLEGKLVPYCKHRGYRQLRQLTVDVLRAFRQTWKYSPLSAVKRLEYLRAFLRFCNESGWVESNPALTLKQTKVTHRPTMPFDADEVARIFDATERVAHKGRFGPQVRTMVLLLQYSGLRIQDAACLARSRLLGDKLFLYTQKTGTPVYCPLPKEVVAALASVPNGHEDHFFWDRKSTPESVVKSWDRVFAGVFAAAKPPIKKGHPHRFRDTFAVSLLTQGVSLEHVSKLLGHSSIKVTERHYSPWVKARQDQLEADVRRIWTT
jgi:integrase/recombinase XerD